jgi:hypothetical protein
MTRQVFDTAQVAHVWAQGRQEEGRNPARRVFFDGPRLFSYGRHFLTAYRLPDGREKARGLDPSGFPALCAAFRGQVAALCRQIAKSRKARAKLAEGHAEELYFWNGEERLRAAFCEAAGLESFPA